MVAQPLKSSANVSRDPSFTRRDRIDFFLDGVGELSTSIRRSEFVAQRNHVSAELLVLNDQIAVLLGEAGVLVLETAYVEPQGQPCDQRSGPAKQPPTEAATQQS